MVRLDPGATVRPSRRGLVVAGATGESALFEHPRATQLPTFLEDDPPDVVLEERLGPPLQPGLIDGLRAMHVLIDADADADAPSLPVDEPSVRISREGLLLRGVAVPAVLIDRHVLPALGSIPGRILLLGVVLAGVVALLSGRPTVPQVSASPGTEVLLMMAVVLVGGALHELGHAVAMVHFGVLPRRAGVGFSWGALSFFVDSSPVMTLPRRQRVVQALAGLAVDSVVVCVLALVAHLARSDLVQIVAWRMAILELAAVGLNVLPFLELDGHWALADALDEPDLSARARRDLGAALRGRIPFRGFALYGAVSLVGGVALVLTSAAVFWVNAGHLVVALFTGDVGSVLLGVWYVLPVLVGLTFTLIGLAVETVAGPGAGSR